MIRSLGFVCSECGAKYVPGEQLFYRDDFSGSGIRETKFICDKCIKAWRDKWQIKQAVFHEQDYVLTVDVTLADGSKFENLDCTAIAETETVVVGEDIPEEAQHQLYVIYAAWDLQRKAKVLRDCVFNEEFMRTTVTCATYGGEQFEKVAFRVNRKGQLETEIFMPDYVKEQVLEAYRLYESQEDLPDVEETGEEPEQRDANPECRQYHTEAVIVKNRPKNIGEKKSWQAQFTSWPGSKK